MKNIGIGLLVVVLGGGAAAGPFVNIQRFDGSSKAGAEVTYLNVDSGNNNGITLLRFDGHIQYVKPEAHAGGYLQLPLSYASGNGQTVTSLGDVEVGGIYIPQLSPTDFSLVLHAGITLPTASDDQDKAEVGSLGGILRIHDIYETLPKGTSLRVGASPMLRSGKVYARLDIGADINIDNAFDTRAKNAYHLNVGGGLWATPSVAVTAELSTMYIPDDIDGDDDTVSVGALAARFNAGVLSPYVGLLIPFDNNISDFINLGIVLGADAAL